MKIFVYGALSKSMRRFGVLSDSQFKGNGFTEGIFYDVSVYPAAGKAQAPFTGKYMKWMTKKSVNWTRSKDTVPKIKTNRCISVKKSISYCRMTDHWKKRLLTFSITTTAYCS